MLTKGEDDEEKSKTEQHRVHKSKLFIRTIEKGNGKSKEYLANQDKEREVL